MTRSETALANLGWDDEWETTYRQLATGMADSKRSNIQPARITNQHRIGFRIATAVGVVEAILPMRTRHHAESKTDLPTVGDWVVAHTDPASGQTTVESVLPRRSLLVRKSAGRKYEEQVIAANIDSAFIVCGLDSDFNLRRIERYLAMVRESGARPVIILNKRDLCDDPKARIAEANRVAGSDTPVMTTCALRNEGVDALEPYLHPGETVALLGSSGVGKSTLINDLLGEERQGVGEVRTSDERGQHTTRARDLIILPGGAIVIDNPGIRELELWVGEEDLRDSFADIEAIAAGCRFSDCRHESEPGCAIRQAIENNELDESRLANFRKMLDEVAGRERAQRTRRGPRRKR